MKLSSNIAALIFLLFVSTFTIAQVDSVIVEDESISTDSNWRPKKSLSSRYNALSKQKKAGLFSAVIPGLGQTYNKKYWKLPIIYGIGGFMVASAIYHHREYKKVRDGLVENIWDTSGVSIPYPIEMKGQVFYFQDRYIISNEAQYRTARDQQRGKRDLFIVYSTLFYALNIIDAIVDAHLQEFDLSDDLSLEINPNIYNTNNKFAAGVTLNFNLK